MVMNVADALSAYRQTMNSSLKGATGAEEPVGVNFSDTLKNFMNDAVQSLQEGEKAAAAGATGKANLQEVVLAVNNAELMMQTVTVIRDKVISAYQDIIRTSI